MTTILYYLALPFLYLLAYLPFRILYLLSDLLYMPIYRIFGYLKKVVTENSQNSFPEKSAAEIDKIIRNHYRYFCDLILEIIKTLTVKSAVLKKQGIEDIDAPVLS